MSRYIIKPDDPQNLVTVDIYLKIEPNGGFRILSEKEEASLADKDNLPEDIVKESSTWLKKRSFGVTNLMEDEYIVEAPGKKLGEPSTYKRDFAKLQMARIKYLLKDWTLKDDDPQLKLRFEVVPETGIQIIETQLLRFLDACVDETILNAFLSRAMVEILGEVKENQKEPEETKN